MANFTKRSGNAIEDLGSLVCTCSDEKPFSVVDVVLSTDTDEKGIMSQRKHTSGDILLSIDSKYFINEDTIDPEVSLAIDKAAIEVPDLEVFHLKMIMALYDCKNASTILASTTDGKVSDVSPSNSVRALYFETLPRNFSHMPMNYSDEVLDSFGPSFPLAFLARKLRKQSKQAYELLSSLDVLKKSTFSYPDEEFVNWAVCCLNSRCFELDKKCMVPFADLFNHSFDPTLIHEIDSENGKISFRAARDLKENEELTIKYQKVNDSCSFLLHYGFTPDTKQEIQSYFRVSFSPEDVLQGTILTQAIQSLGLTPTADMALPATLSQPLPALWIWLLRLKGMNDKQRNSFMQGQVEVSGATESAAWLEIHQVLTTHMKWYDSFNETDDEVRKAEEVMLSPHQVDVCVLTRSIRSNARQVIAAAISQLPSMNTSS